MQVIITGGRGFLGQRIAEEILERGGLALPGGRRLEAPEIVLADLGEGTVSPALEGKVSCAVLDVADAAAVSALVGPETAAVFHLAAVVSAGAEADFDLGMRVNLDGTRNVLEACRALPEAVPLVSTSSLAVFGGALPAKVHDGQAVQPENSYGVQKAIGELLCADYRRKGFCDTRVLRLPTVIIRPGKPNAAASSFASSILREPLNGEEAVCPVDEDLELWVTSPEAAVSALLHAMEVSAADWPKFGVVNPPGLKTSVREMLAALERAAGRQAVARVRFAKDETIAAIVGSWPRDFDTATAEGLGFPACGSVDEIISGYLGRYGQRAA
ncbi:MAG: NAD-dependent epimerase/dehydratase family protein [Alphaproteobacteria bacterium]|nr:MAG: NAD-dependent epimerase/dehydratase family protein [Alphaproteobacteria bacterium]